MAGRREPRWVGRPVVDAVHLDLVREHGGAIGVRDEAALEAALARPLNRWAYDAPDLAALAACYGYGLARSHPYVDGNKRVAFVVMAAFLGLNGLAIEADEGEVVALMLETASGTLTEDVLAAWVRTHTADR